MKRQILKSDFSITSWELLSPYFEELNQREINSQNQLEKNVFYPQNSGLNLLITSIIFI